MVLCGKMFKIPKRNDVLPSQRLRTSSPRGSPNRLHLAAARQKSGAPGIHRYGSRISSSRLLLVALHARRWRWYSVLWCFMCTFEKLGTKVGFPRRKADADNQLGVRLNYAEPVANIRLLSWTHLIQVKNFTCCGRHECGKNIS